ncbi:MAG: hypothetical protein IQL11_05290 [Bacteroidales bacterium]|nr:hypothetical protein [Bacteroidales bacterium]
MADSSTTLNRTGFTDEFGPDSIAYRRQLYVEQSEINPVMDNLISEGGEHFVNYLKWLGLDNEANLLTLSSRHHYYYDHSDLKGVKVLVNLRKLNQIKHLESFLHVVFRVLPPNAVFVGCFSDSRNEAGKGTPFFQSSRLYNRLINFLDSKTDREMNRRDVVELLDSHGFKVVDMADINGMTYFTTHNQRKSGE